MSLDFTLVDVFSDRPFGGNQLAVFPDAVGIPDETMQQVAREFNFSETTFVLPPRDSSHACKVRIFTPYQELPFAGHPTIGTAAVLAGRSSSSATEQTFILEEDIGPVTVTVDADTIRLRLGNPDYETSDQMPPAAAIAKALTVPEDAVVESWYAGVGLRFCFVRLATAKLVDQSVLDKAAWEEYGISNAWSPHLYVFSGDYRDGEYLHARFFAPAVGVDEDPATGSACAALVASIAHQSEEQDDHYRVRINQGMAMGRPSFLEGTATKRAGALIEVVVSGKATIVGEGTMTLGGL